MDGTGERIAAAAVALVGVPFRLHGRVPASGLDCIGLALCALRGGGVPLGEPPAYRLHASRAERAEMWMRGQGLRVVDDAAPGDIGLVRVGPLQLHFVVAAGDHVVHAHAGLGRVVSMPLPAEWQLLSRWRAAYRAERSEQIWQP